jgi:6-phosphogluconate dehydrogenase (decarboxylating)
MTNAATEALAGGTLAGGVQVKCATEGGPVKIGIVELGRMGPNMAERLLKGGHQVVGSDLDPEAVARLAAAGGEGAADLAELAVAAALEPGVAAPAIAGALMERFRTQDEKRFGDRLLAALRREFGGHPVRPAAGGEER